MTKDVGWGMTYGHPNLGHGRDLRDILRAEGTTPQAQSFWRSPSDVSASLSPPQQPRVDRPSPTMDAFLMRLEETENLPKVFALKPESRSPPNFPQGRHDLFYKDSSLVAKLDHVRHRQKIAGEARAELW